MIPYNTDAPLYHLPIVTVGLIVLNTVLFFVVPSSLLEPEEISLDIVGADSLPSTDEWDEEDMAQWEEDFNNENEDGEAGAAEVDLPEIRVTATYPKNTLILQHGAGIKPWQWVSSIFMHSGFFHLLFNMIALWAFGLVVEGKVGAFVFLALYMGIGVGQSAIEQTVMSFAGGGGSLGASAAIFGILGIAIVWAPRNEFDVFWAMGFHVGSIELPIMTYGFISFAMEFVSVAFGRFGISSGLLHLMGLAIGIGLGLLWLRRGWVDCEGWDLINTLKGTEGHVQEDEELNNEARDLVRSSLASRSQTATAAAPAPTSPASQAAARPTPAESPNPEDLEDLFSVMPVASPVAGSAQNLEQLITDGRYATAVKLLSRLRKNGNAPELGQPLLGKLIRGLLGAKEYSSATKLMAEHIRRFPQNRVKLQLNLAKVLLHMERPRKALRVLQEIERDSLDDPSRTTYRTLAAHARKQIDEGVIELSE